MDPSTHPMSTYLSRTKKILNFRKIILRKTKVSVDKL